MVPLSVTSPPTLSPRPLGQHRRRERERFHRDECQRPLLSHPLHLPPPLDITCPLQRERHPQSTPLPVVPLTSSTSTVPPNPPLDIPFPNQRQFPQGISHCHDPPLQHERHPQSTPLPVLALTSSPTTVPPNPPPRAPSPSPSLQSSLFSFVLPASDGTSLSPRQKASLLTLHLIGLTIQSHKSPSHWLDKHLEMRRMGYITNPDPVNKMELLRCPNDDKQK